MAISEKASEFLNDPTYRRAHFLITEGLSRCQPSAIKHNYLNSVINAFRHPIARASRALTDADYEIHMVGYGNPNRTLPLHLIIDYHQPDKSVKIRHAFVPNPRSRAHTGQKTLVRALQEEENKWCAERGVTPRDIEQEIISKGPDHINRHGLNTLPDAAFGQLDRENMLRDSWLPTDFIDPCLEVDHPGKPDVMDQKDVAKVTENIKRSFNMVRNPDDQKVEAIWLKLRRQHYKKYFQVVDVNLSEPQTQDLTVDFGLD